jgi:hypothetical protein
MQAPPAAGPPVNGQPGPLLPPAGVPTRYFGSAEFRHMLDAGRWLADHCAGLPEPANVEIDGESRIVLVSFRDPRHVQVWAEKFAAKVNERANNDLVQVIVGATVGRHGWEFVFRAVVTAPNRGGWR